MWGTQKVITSQSGTRSSTSVVPVAGGAAFGEWRKSMVEGAYKPSKHLQDKVKAPGSARSSKASARGRTSAGAAKPSAAASPAAAATAPAGADDDGTSASAAAPAATPAAVSADAAEPGKLSSEEQEVRGLISLFNASRESPVPVGVYVKYQQSLENIAKAEQVSAKRRDATASPLGGQIPPHESCRCGASCAAPPYSSPTPPSLRLASQTPPVRLTPSLTPNARSPLSPSPRRPAERSRHATSRGWRRRVSSTRRRRSDAHACEDGTPRPKTRRGSGGSSWG